LVFRIPNTKYFEKLHCVLKTRHPILTIISSNLNWFSKFFHCCKVC